MQEARYVFLIGQSLPTLTIDESSFTADSSSRYIVDGQTLVPGGRPIVVSGKSLSLAALGSALIIDSKPSAIPAAPVQAPVITLGSSTYTAKITPQATPRFIIASQTLAAGDHPITISGTRYSLAPSASALVVYSSTLLLPTTAPSAAMITFGSSLYTADSSSNFVIDGTTLSPGSAITISGTPVSFGIQATDVVIGSSIEPVK